MFVINFDNIKTTLCSSINWGAGPSVTCTINVLLALALTIVFNYARKLRVVIYDRKMFILQATVDSDIKLLCRFTRQALYSLYLP